MPAGWRHLSRSDGHDLGFLLGHVLVDILDVTVGEILDLLLQAVQIVLRDVTVFLEFLDGIHGGVASLADGSQLTSDLLLVLATGFVLQGLAVIHWQFHARKWPGAFLLLVYLPMLPVLAGPAVAAGAWLSVAAIGFIDNWFVLRRSNENMV